MVDLSGLIPEARPIAGPVAEVYLKHTAPWFIGLIVHGSAVKGGVIPGCSDLDFHLYLEAAAFGWRGQLPLELGFAIRRDLEGIDLAPFRYVQCYPHTRRLPEDWVGPVPGAYHLLAGELPVAEATDGDLRRSARRALAELDPAPAFLMGKLLGHGGVRLERSLRLLCTKVWPVLYQVLTLQARDGSPIELWCLTKEQAIRRLPRGTALRNEIERFHRAVWAYYPAEDSLEHALSAIEHGVAFLQAARSWWDRYQPEVIQGRCEMLGTSLYDAVGRFAAVTQGVADPELDREWAWGAYDSEGVRFAFFRTYEELRELAARTAAERSARGPALSAAQRILAQYHSAYRDLEAALLGNSSDESGPALIGAAEAAQAPAEEEWPVRQVVAHITGAEVGFYGVVKYALERHRSGDGRPAEIPDEAWDDLTGETEEAFRAMMEGSLDSLRAYHAALHERILREFAGIGDEELDLPSMYWEGAELSLRFRLHRFDSHLRQHTVQVDKTLVKIGQAPNEAKRLLRLIYGALAEAEAATLGAWEASAAGAWEASAAGAWEASAALRDEVAGAISARADEVAAILA